MQMDPLALHHLAKKSAGTLTRYQALLGRTLLAIERTGAYLDYGCSGVVHYAVNQLSMPVKKARLLLRVARELETLPYLRYLANVGESEWFKRKSFELLRSRRSESGPGCVRTIPTPRSKIWWLARSGEKYPPTRP